MLKRGISRLALFTTMFVVLCGGPFGMEEIVPLAGPGLFALTLLVVPILWAIPYTLITAELVSELVDQRLPRPGFWSINYPAPLPVDPGNNVHRVPVAECSWPIHFERADVQDGRSMKFQYAAPYWERGVTEPSDYTVIRDGGIAVSAVPLFCRF